MAQPLRIENDGTLYHVTARGNEQKSIFKDNSTANSSSARFCGLLVNPLEPIQHAWADDGVIEAGCRAGGEVTASTSTSIA